MMMAHHLNLVVGITSAVLLVSLSQSVLSADKTSVHWTDNPHDLIQGNCTDLDGRDPSHDYRIKQAVTGQVVEDVLHYAWPDQPIFCIRMFDRVEDGTGGFPFIQEGGVGRDFVSLGYRSQPSMGIEYYVEMYVVPYQRKTMKTALDDATA